MTTLQAHVHTALVLVAFVAALVVYAVAPDQVLENLLLLLGGGVVGTAGTTVGK